MPTKRRFHILDAIILVAFTAVGMALCVAFDRLEAQLLQALPPPAPPPAPLPPLPPAPLPLAPPEFVSPFGDHVPTLPPGVDAQSASLIPTPPPVVAARSADPFPLRVHTYCRYLTLLLIAWGFAFLVLRLRKPRPRLRRLFRSPGAAACLTVFVMLIVTFAEFLTTWLLSVVRPLNGFSVDWTDETMDIAESVGIQAAPAIIAIWVVLALNRGLQLGRDWLELCGLLVAAGWILLLFETPVCNLLWSF